MSIRERLSLITFTSRILHSSHSCLRKIGLHSNINNYHAHSITQHIKSTQHRSEQGRSTTSHLHVNRPISYRPTCCWFHVQDDINRLSIVRDLIAQPGKVELVLYVLLVDLDGVLVRNTCWWEESARSHLAEELVAPQCTEPWYPWLFRRWTHRQRLSTWCTQAPFKHRKTKASTLKSHSSAHCASVRLMGGAN